MARLASLSVLLDPTGQDFLAEEYGKVIENVQKNTISGALKNTDLSGTPTAGTVEAKRFANTESAAYGTARAGGAGQKIKAKPVTVPINVDKEIINEIEQKDVSLYGVDSVVSRKITNNGQTMIRELERAFFATAATAATAVTVTGTSIADDAETLIQTLETVKNDYVDGVDRSMISVVCDVATYGKLRTYLNEKTNNANVNTSAEMFTILNGVRFAPSVYMPTGVKMLAMVDGAIAQPVLPTVYNPTKIELSNAIGFGMFYSYGTVAVTPDLIFKVVA